MKKTRTTRILSLLLALCAIVGILAVPAAAAGSNALDIPTASRYAKVFTLAKSGTTIPYTTSSLKTRGTVTYGASSSSYIDNASDEVYLLDVGVKNGVCWGYVSYPTASNGRVKAYINLSAITTATTGTSTPKTMASATFYCANRYGNSVSSSYYVSRGDTVYKLATKGSYTQILYPSGSVYRIGWCKSSDYNKYCTASSSDTNTTSSNVASVNGVKLTEYPIGSTYTSDRYVTISGKSYDTNGWQCCGFARYVLLKVYGVHDFSSSKYTDVCAGKFYSRGELTTTKLKNLITQAGVGAHIRTGTNAAGNAHSMIITAVTSTGFSVVDANSDGRNTVATRSYTWSSYLSCEYGSRGIDYINKYTG